MSSPDRPSVPPRHPPFVWLALGGTILMDCVVQLLWKRLAGALPDSDDPVLLLTAAIALPAMWGMAALLLVQLLVWLYALRRSELSFAQPLTSLSYVGVGLLSWAWLGEPLHARGLVSIALILAGVWLVSGHALFRERS